MKTDRQFWQSSSSDGWVNPFPALARNEVVSACRYMPVIDYGCGVGRLASSFGIDQYRGVDINRDRVQTARIGNAGYTFDAIDGHRDLRGSDCGSLIVDNVLIHVPDDEIEDMIETFCLCARAIVQCEHFGRKRWRRGRYGHQRDKEEYLQMFGHYEFQPAGITEVFNERINANLSVVTWEKK